MKALIKVYPINLHKGARTEMPDYVIENGEFYRTITHARGWSERPDYTLQADGMVCRTRHHPLGASETPDFRLHNKGRLYRTTNHPDGPSIMPVYEIRD